jgi:hypothetical protein
VGFFGRLLGRKSDNDAGGTAGYQPVNPDMLKLAWQQMRGCPVCGRELVGHRYALVATTALLSRRRRKIDRFLRAVDRKNPRDLEPFQDWDARGENAEAYALCCPDGNIALAVAHTGAAPPHFKNVIRCDSLGPERSREFEAAVPADRWAIIADRDNS